MKANEERRVNVLGLWVWGRSKRKKRDGVAAVVGRERGRITMERGWSCGYEAGPRDGGK